MFHKLHIQGQGAWSKGQEVTSSTSFLLIIFSVYLAILLLPAPCSLPLSRQSKHSLRKSS